MSARTNGNTIGPARRRDLRGVIRANWSPAEKLEQFSIPEPNSGCLLWTGKINPGGYGTVGFGNRTYSAHRVSYGLAFGPIPTGMHVCHKCDVRSCIEPNHLFLGTRHDNMSDMSRKGRAATGERNGKSTLTAEIVAEMRASGLSGRAISRRYGVSPSHASMILRGALWRI